jgi:Rhodopirellula transposase DDE domain
VRRLAQALQAQGHEVSRTLVAELLNEAGYSLQANRKTKKGDSHPDRDAQFARINTQVAAALAEKQPVISVDSKKKELVGDFRNNGREYRPQGNPEAVRVHDFLIKELGRAVPYGVYDLAANSGWVSVGVDHDTAAFAVNSIRQWWQAVGRARYPDATRLLITADGGGSNGSRVRLWKRELQKLANELGLDIVVSHLPPGTSKWNKIEHRLFSFISQNWRAKPLVSYRVIVELIDLGDHHQNRSHRALRTRYWPIPQRHCRFRRRDGRHQHQTRRIPRRVELHYLAEGLSARLRVYFLTSP